MGSASQGPAAPDLDTGSATNMAQAQLLPLLSLLRTSALSPLPPPTALPFWQTEFLWPALVRRGLMKTTKALAMVLHCPAAGTGAGCGSAPGCHQYGCHPHLLHLVVLPMMVVWVVLWVVMMSKPSQWVSATVRATRWTLSRCLCRCSLLVQTAGAVEAACPAVVAAVAAVAAQVQACQYALPLLPLLPPPQLHQQQQEPRYCWQLPPCPGGQRRVLGRAAKAAAGVGRRAAAATDGRAGTPAAAPWGRRRLSTLV